MAPATARLREALAKASSGLRRRRTLGSSMPLRRKLAQIFYALFDLGITPSERVPVINRRRAAFL
jgi:hypothetical protein